MGVTGSPPSCWKPGEEVILGTSEKPAPLLLCLLETGPSFSQKALQLKLGCEKDHLQSEVVPWERPDCKEAGGWGGWDGGEEPESCGSINIRRPRV